MCLKIAQLKQSYRETYSNVDSAAKFLHVAEQSGNERAFTTTNWPNYSDEFALFDP